MYPDESSRVVVYCLGGRNMLVWCMYNGLWICIWLHWWNDFGSSLPFACLIVLCGSSLLRWSSNYWCEQKWEVLAVNRRTVTPLY